MRSYLDPDLVKRARHAVIVPGHAILTDFSDPQAEDGWILLDFQRGETGCYVEHVRRGVQLASEDSTSLLVFSGGQSRREAGPRSEAWSYFWIADRFGWLGKAEVASRATTEEFARDSFENLLFGICRFKECVGQYPERVTFAGWAFKEERFELHRNAIRWPRDRYRYVGVNDPPMIEQARAAEAITAAGYAADPYSAGAEFRAKRDVRNPFRRQHGYSKSCPELAGLLDHTGSELYDSELPWND